MHVYSHTWNCTITIKKRLLGYRLALRRRQILKALFSGRPVYSENRVKSRIILARLLQTSAFRWRLISILLLVLTLTFFLLLRLYLFLLLLLRLCLPFFYFSFSSSFFLLLVALLSGVSGWFRYVVRVFLIKRFVYVTLEIEPIENPRLTTFSPNVQYPLPHIVICFIVPNFNDLLASIKNPTQKSIVFEAQIIFFLLILQPFSLRLVVFLDTDEAIE